MHATLNWGMLPVISEHRYTCADVYSNAWFHSQVLEVNKLWIASKYWSRFKKIHCIWICPHLQIFEYVSKGKHQSVNRDRAGENVNEIISQKSYVTRDHPIAASQAGDS